MNCPCPSRCDEAQTCVGRCRPGSIFNSADAPKADPEIEFANQYLKTIAGMMGQPLFVNQAQFDFFKSKGVDTTHLRIVRTLPL